MNKGHCLLPPDDLDSAKGDDSRERQFTAQVPPPEESIQPSSTTTTSMENIDSEKNATRHLKRELKQRSRIRKYELRWSQALGRNDTVVANRAQSELREYLVSLRDEPNSWWYQHDFPSFYQEFLEASKTPTTSTTLLPSVMTLTSEADESSFLVKNRRWMTKLIWQPLVLRMILPTDACTNDPTNPAAPQHSHVTDENVGPSRIKQQQTREARNLLNHMTKGTQTETMFENDAALIGYTRQKFMERALLALKSLHRLYPLASSLPPTSTASTSPTTLPGQLWQQLIQVRSILSIGCGPGCDALGVLTFLKHYRSNDNAVLVDRIVWMDYVMPQWKRLVLDHLTSLLTTETRLVSRVDMATCDVRYSLCHDPRNQKAWECFLGITNEDDDNKNLPIDLIVVSYLLTETRGQWIHFFQDLLSYYCDPGHDNKTCLLLLSEPKAWQLHAFTTTFANYIDGFQWLDSSRDCPDLQPLERRLGPAVLLLRTKKVP